MRKTSESILIFRAVCDILYVCESSDTVCITEPSDTRREYLLQVPYYLHRQNCNHSLDQKLSDSMLIGYGKDQQCMASYFMGFTTSVGSSYNFCGKIWNEGINGKQLKNKFDKVSNG